MGKLYKLNRDTYRYIVFNSYVRYMNNTINDTMANTNTNIVEKYNQRYNGKY